MKAREWPEWVRHNATNILRAVIILLFLGLAAWAIVLNHFDRVIANSEPWLLLTDALIDVAPELAGIVIGVVTIDYLNERRQREQLKAQLIRQMGMNIRDVAVLAARELAYHRWLYDGSLSRATLFKANLSEANLSGANLSKTNLSEAKLTRANLIGARLLEANLKRANLSGANLRGADLRGATSWTIEQLEQARLLEGAIMPDGVKLKGLENEGPTFQEWKAQHLAKQGAERAKNEPANELNDSTVGQAERGSPEQS